MTRPLQVYLDDHDLARLEAWTRELRPLSERDVRCRTAGTVPPAPPPLPLGCSSIAAAGSRCAAGATSTMPRRIVSSAKLSGPEFHWSPPTSSSPRPIA